MPLERTGMMRASCTLLTVLRLLPEAVNGDFLIHDFVHFIKFVTRDEPNVEHVIPMSFPEPLVVTGFRILQCPTGM